LLLSLSILLSGCVNAREVVDGGTAAAFRGQDYLAIDGSRFNVDPSALERAGRVDSTNIEDSDGSAYALPGVDPAVAFVVRHADGTFVVFAPSQYFAPGQPPLGQAVPALCPFLIEPAADACR
jgi:hypothetical protein